MLPAYLATRELERRRREESAEAARQLPLYVGDIPPPPPEGEEDKAATNLPDWATNY